MARESGDASPGGHAADRHRRGDHSRDPRSAARAGLRSLARTSTPSRHRCVTDLPRSAPGSDAISLVAAIRHTFPSASGGLHFHLTGTIPGFVDQQSQSKSSQGDIQKFSLLFIIVLLLIAFRALLAPLVTLLPAALVLALASPVIAGATHLGVQVSAITQFILIVLVLGAGTDYGLFLVFRTREELRRGLEPKDAVRRAVATVGESITFSALIVIAALMSLIIAQFDFYQSLGPALAIGIALMLMAGLTLLPALLAIFGRAVFWPSKARLVENPRANVYGRIAAVVVRRPLPVAVVGAIIFGAIALGQIGTTTAGFADQSAPTGTNSAAGDTLITEHYGSANLNATEFLFKFQTSIWSHADDLQTIQTALATRGGFAAVEGPLTFSGQPLTPDAARGAAHLGECAGARGTRALRQPRRAHRSVHRGGARRQRVADHRHSQGARARDEHRCERERAGFRCLRDPAVRVRRRSTLVVRPLAHHPGRGDPHRHPARDRDAQPRRAALPGHERRCSRTSRRSV